MDGFEKAQTGIIAMLVLVLALITRRLPERRFSSGTTTRLMLTGAVLLLVLAVCSMPVYAACCEKPLETRINGTVIGGVYIDGGCDSPATFDVPAGNIEWARLYTASWAHDSVGWINTSFYNGTGYTYSNQTANHYHDCTNNAPDRGCYAGCGLGGGYLTYWNVTDIVGTGYNNATVDVDGNFHIQGVLLVAVYNNSGDGGTDATVYWINDGYVYIGINDPTCLCHESPSTTWFNGAMPTNDNATLYTGYTVADEGEEDWLDFNGQRVSDDAGRDCDGIWADKWDVHKGWLRDTNNNVTFTGITETAARVFLAVFLNETPEPDLAATAIDTLLEFPDGQTPIAFVANHTYKINVTIANVGAADAGTFNATFGAFNATTGNSAQPVNNTTFTTGLNASSVNVTTYYWTPTAAGDYNLTATADSDGDVVNDTNDANNATTKLVTVLAEGAADLEIVSDDITFHPAYKNNNTIVRVVVRNNGTGGAGNDTNLFNVTVANTTTVLNWSKTWLYAKSKTIMEFEVDLPKGPTSVDVELDPGNVTEDDHNNATGNVNIVMCRVRDTHFNGNSSPYNGTFSHNTTVEMFDVVKLAPEGSNPVELAASVANSSKEGGRGFLSLDGIEEVGAHSTWWIAFANGVPVDSPWTYQLHDNDTIHWDFTRYINSLDPTNHFKPRPVMDYPEPFLHGYNGTVYNITIVYPNEGLYPAKAEAINRSLNDSGVPQWRINTKTDDEVTGDEKANNTLILLGTPSNNNLTKELNDNHMEVGMPVYFNDTGMMIDDLDDTPYPLGGVVEACGNPYNSSWVDAWDYTGPSIWLATAADDCWAYPAADMLASDTGKLDRFWKIREPYLIPTWDGANVTLDWSNWTGTCASFDIYINNTPQFSSPPNYTVTGTTWTDIHANPPHRFYKVTCNGTVEPIEGILAKITYPLLTGRNWITLLCMNPPITSADESIKDIQPNCSKVGWWNSTSQQMEIYKKRSSGVFRGTDFEVKPKRGYEVQVTVDTAWTVVGWVPDCPIKLISGRNWVGMPFNTTIDDADELIRDIQPNCSKVGWWNSTSQQMEIYKKRSSGVFRGTNFEVKPARGYEVQVTAATVWTPR